MGPTAMILFFILLTICDISRRQREESERKYREEFRRQQDKY